MVRVSNTAAIISKPQLFVDADFHLVWLPVLQDKLVDLIEEVLGIAPVIIAKYAIICHWNRIEAPVVTRSSIAAKCTSQHDQFMVYTYVPALPIFSRCVSKRSH